MSPAVIHSQDSYLYVKLKTIIIRQAAYAMIIPVVLSKTVTTDNILQAVFLRSDPLGFDIPQNKKRHDAQGGKALLRGIIIKSHEAQ